MNVSRRERCPEARLGLRLVHLCLGLVLTAVPAITHSGDLGDDPGSTTPLPDQPIATESVQPIGWCGTQLRFEQELKAMGYDPQAASPACPEYGPCDVPTTRDDWLVGPGTPITTIRLAIHVVAHDDGSNPFTTPEMVQEAVGYVNQHYLSSRIQFIYEFHQVNESDWRSLSQEEIDDMKTATAYDPTQWLNIWMTTVTFGYSFGTFPFSSNALEPTGGIVMSQNHWGGNFSGFAHEIGHCLGLWHVFNGVAEVDECGPCYEAVDAPDRDLLGDRCADTPPTPPWYECSDADGVDACSGLPWGSTQPENIMGYTPIDCRTLFTPQQAARMRCWINDVLFGWIDTSQEDCCEDRVGDANNSGDIEPTIGDIAIMVDAKFVTSYCAGLIECLAEADVNLSGAGAPTCDDITIADISTLIDYLFIVGAEAYGPLPDCL
jgi:hypothetical protein